MKEQFKEAEVELIEFCEDVIATSGHPPFSPTSPWELPLGVSSTGGQPTSDQPTSGQ